MREYKPEQNVQKKAYYTDRFRFADRIPTQSVEEDFVYAELEGLLKGKFEIINSYLMRKEWVIEIKPADNVSVLEFFKTTLGFAQLTEMSAIDWVEQSNEFEVFYQLLNFDKAKRARVKCKIQNGHNIESVTKIYSSANWAEREMYDMFGIFVNNHPMLKRILMPDDWHDHPLLKTYPLQGDEAASWYEVDKIYGKEAREIIGPEQRDAAFISVRDTERFARLGHEVARGAPYSDEVTPISYQEKDKPFLFANYQNPPKPGNQNK